MQRNFIEEADKALEPKVNVLSEQLVEKCVRSPSEVRSRLEALSTNVTNLRMATLDSIKREYFTAPPRFGVRLRDIEHPTVLEGVINDMQKAVHEDVAFYNKMTDTALQNLRTMSVWPNSLDKDVARASRLTSLPMEIRVLLRSSLGSSWMKVINGIHLIISYLEVEHTRHQRFLNSLANSIKNALASLLLFAQEKAEIGQDLFGLRTGIIQHLSPLTVEISRYLLENQLFHVNLSDAFESITESLEEINETRNVLLKKFTGRMLHYKHPRICFRIGTAMEFELVSEIFEAEIGIAKALWRLFQLCTTLQDI